MWFHSHEVPGVATSFDSERRRLVARGWGRGDGELVFKGVEIR